MKVYFIDTNLFLECRKASDLPWHELDGAKPGEGPDVRLIVPRTVVSEIDRHKGKGSGRKAKRARDASAVLRKAFTSGRHATELRAANPRVVLELPRIIRPDFSQFPNLDPNWPDDRIAAEYVEMRKTEPNLQVLTDDTYLAIAVRSLGFEPILIPKSWKLEPEKDGRDDEIDRLRDKLKTYEQTSPDMSLAVLNADDEEVESICGTITVLAPSRDEIDSALTSIEATFPMLEGFPRTEPGSRLGIPPSAKWQPPSDDEIEKYKKIYPEWLKSLYFALLDVIQQLNKTSRELPFSVRIANTGFANAANVRLTVTGYDGIMLLDGLSVEESEQNEEEVSLPPPPLPPLGHYVGLKKLSLASAPIPPPRSLTQPERDPNRFYFTRGRPITPVRDVELTCQAFPHQADPDFLGFRAVIPDDDPDDDLGDQPRIRVRLQASNLKKPIERFLPISTVVQPGDFKQLVERLERDLEWEVRSQQAGLSSRWSRRSTPTARPR